MFYSICICKRTSICKCICMCKCEYTDILHIYRICICAYVRVKNTFTICKPLKQTNRDATYLRFQALVVTRAILWGSSSFMSKKRNLKSVGSGWIKDSRVLWTLFLWEGDHHLKLAGFLNCQSFFKNTELDQWNMASSGYSHNMLSDTTTD